MQLTFTSLWRSPTFLTFWAGQAISQVGSEVSLLALPLAAVLTLHADAAQMGVLGAAGRAPYLVFGLFAGVWVDRLRRRPLLIAADVGRFLLLATIPLAALLGTLGIAQLVLVTFAVGALGVFFDAAYQSFLPVLVTRDKLVEGNAKLESSASIARIAGPSVAGALVQLLSPAITIAVDALSFLVSAVSLAFARAEEPAPARRSSRSVWGDIGEGLRALVELPTVRVLVAYIAATNIFGGAILAVYVLYLTRDLGLTPAAVGLVLAAAGPGALLGSVAAGRLSGRLGMGRTLVGSTLLCDGKLVLIPLALVLPAVALPLLLAERFLHGLTRAVFEVNQISFRQAVVPDNLLGRVNASVRFVVWGLMPIGFLLGGVLGELIGNWGTLVAATVGTLLLATPLMVLSPLRRLRGYPSAAA